MKEPWGNGRKLRESVGILSISFYFCEVKPCKENKI